MDVVVAMESRSMEAEAEAEADAGLVLVWDAVSVSVRFEAPSLRWEEVEDPDAMLSLTVRDPASA